MHIVGSGLINGLVNGVRHALFGGNQRKQDMSDASDEPTSEAAGCLTRVQLLQNKLGVDDSPTASSASLSDLGEPSPVFGASRGVSFAMYTEQGRRTHMEDRSRIADLARHPALQPCQRASFFGVFDGHSGDEVAQYLSDHLLDYVLEDVAVRTEPVAALRRAVLRCEGACAALHAAGSCNAGSTALSALLVDDKLYLANVGDCRAIVARSSVAVQLTEDHKASNLEEGRRIRDAGVHVSTDGYVFGEVAVSRAIGSQHLKLNPLMQGALISEPELHEYSITPEDDFLVLATDGLWEVVRNQEVVRFARRYLAESRDPQSCAKKLVEAALRMGGQDNVSVIVVCLHERPIAMARGNSMLFRHNLSASSSPRPSGYDSPREDTPTPTPTPI